LGKSIPESTTAGRSTPGRITLERTTTGRTTMIRRIMRGQITEKTEIQKYYFRKNKSERTNQD
jgi:hypothetical protein